MKNIESIVLGGGCFWCLDASYRLIKGVEGVVSGYSGGSVANPSSDDVYSETTGHAEVVKIDFDTKIISLDDLLDVFWTIHDPTTMNRQGYDVGSEYRSIILYIDDKQKELVKKSLATTQKVWGNKIVTEIKKLEAFYPAEEMHQNFFQKNPQQSYCQIIINPKLEKLRSKYTSLLK